MGLQLSHLGGGTKEAGKGLTQRTTPVQRPRQTQAALLIFTDRHGVETAWGWVLPSARALLGYGSFDPSSEQGGVDSVIFRDPFMSTIR